MNSPKVTILISVYNGASTLNRCFESIQKQTFQDFEIVCINDGSIDATKNLLEKWQKSFNQRFKLIENTSSLGLTKSLNKGLEKASGTYTARIDADDWWHREKLAKQVGFLDNHAEYGIVGTWYENHGRHGVKQVALPETDTTIRMSIFKHNPFAHSAVVFRTKLIQQSGMYNSNWRYGQDYELWLRILPSTKMVNIPEYLCYRTADDTLSARKQREQMLLCVKTQLYYLKQYHRPLSEYRYIVEPLMIAFTPEWLRTIKRHFL